MHLTIETTGTPIQDLKTPFRTQAVSTLRSWDARTCSSQNAGAITGPTRCTQRQPNVPVLKTFIYLLAPSINSSESWSIGLEYSVPTEKSLIEQPGC